MNERELKYDAFISYRHCPLDQFVAINIHKKLEAFKLPKSAVKLLSGEKKKIERVFRDEEELPLADNLSNPIDRALENSDFLIVICTPRLKESRWCQREIETFLKEHGRERILLVLAEGEPCESFPEILTYEETEITDASGNTSVVRKETEPLAADCRGSNKKEILKKMDVAVMKLVAAMFSLNFDDIKQRHREQKLKRLIAIWSSVSAAIFVFLIVCLFLLAKINIQKNEIEDKFAGAMAVAAEELLEQGRRQDAIYALRQVLPDKNYINSESYRMLNEALNTYGSEGSYVPKSTFEISSAVFEFCVSNDGSLIAIQGKNQDYYLFNVDTGKELFRFTASDAYNEMPVFSFDNRSGFIYSDENTVYYLNTDTFETGVISNKKGFVLSDVNSSITLVLSDNRLYGYMDGNCIYNVSFDDYSIDTTSFMAYEYGFSSDGNYISFAMREFSGKTLVLLIDVKTGDVLSGLYLESEGSVMCATDGDYIFIIEERINSGAGKLTLVDSYTSEVLGSMTLPLTFINAVSMIDDQILIKGPSNAVMLDSRTFAITAQLEDAGSVISGFAYKDAAMISDYMGKLYLLGGEYDYGMDISLNLFSNVPNKMITNCIYAGDRFFYCFADANYITVYSEDENAKRETLNVEEYTDSYGFLDFKDAGDFISDIEGIEKEYVYLSIFSSDDKYIVIAMCDGSIGIYDAKTKKPVKTVYSIENPLLSSFVYIPDEDIYLLNNYPYSYIFDRDLNYIAKTEEICGFSDGNFVHKGTNGYVLVPFVRYKQNLERADELIEGYEPSQTVKERYGLD